MFSAEGIKADPTKIDTIVNCEAPKNVSEIRSFLGMAQYVARFIPDFASRTEPLRRLTRKDVPWEWTQQEQEAFDNIKEALTSTQVMAYFNPAKQTEVLVDASPVGVGAILAQEGKIIAYASRADRCRTEVFTNRQGNASRCLRCRTFSSIPVWMEFHCLH